MAYTVDFSDGTKTQITVPNSAINTTTNLGLVGQGFRNYGEVTAENFLHLLENFANGASPSKPVEGQIWFNSSSRQLNYFDNTVANAGTWKPIASMSVQTNAPATGSEQEGHFWINPDSGQVHIYYNGTWPVVSDIAGDTRVLTRTRYDISDVTHRTVEVIIASKIVSITSSDTVAWQPQNSGPNTEYLEDGVTLLNTQFPTILQGINLNISDGYLFNGTSVRSQYADLAERYHADAVYEYGTVVKIGGQYEITATNTEYCVDVFGIVSENPAYGMNSNVGDQNTHPYVALAGRVPVRVVGTVRKGDRLTSSNITGHAMAGNAGLGWQYVIGRALEDKINEEPGIIEAVVGTK